jgi:hypothetical protein
VAAVVVLAACSSPDEELGPIQEVPLIPVTEPAPPDTGTTGGEETVGGNGDENGVDIIDRFDSGEIYPSDLAVFLLQESNWQNFLYPEVYERLGDGNIYAEGEVIVDGMEQLTDGLDYRVGWGNFWTNTATTFRLVEEIHVLGTAEAAADYQARASARYAVTGVDEYSDPDFDSIFRQGALGEESYVSYYSIPEDTESPDITGGCEAVAFGRYANVVFHARITAEDCLSGYVYTAASLVSAGIERIDEAQALLGR